MRVNHRSLNSRKPPRIRSCAKLLVIGGLLLFAFLYILFVVYTLTSITTSTSSTSTSSAGGEQQQQGDPAIQRRNTDASTATSKATTKKIAYAISVTGCGSDPITDPGAVLKHSIHRASLHGDNNGKYDYDLFAIYHPSAASCALPLQALGYHLLERQVFVNVSDIQGDYLRSKIESNGCCGEKELIKLEAYTLTEYPIVVHLDLDVLVLQPLDELFDMMLTQDSLSPKPPAGREEIIMLPQQQSLPATGADIQAFFTMDYNMVNPSCQYKPVQGGFLVLKPSLQVYNEFKEIVRVGDFQPRHGWGGKVGPFHGSMTFQGLIPYFYNVLHPGHAVELNRCLYNQMCDNPRTGRTVNDVVSGQCRDGQDECEDCRSRPVGDVVTTHFTLCQKPWWCLAHTQDAIQHRLCRQLTREWYKIRSELEQSWGRSGRGSGTYDNDQFYGYCQKGGHQGYIPIEQPYGGPGSSEQQTQR